jgi:hypothetical protein
VQIRLADAETDLALAREKALALDGALIDTTAAQTLTEGSTAPSNPSTNTSTTDTGSSTSSGSVRQLDALRLRHDAETEQRARELAEQQV